MMMQKQYENKLKLNIMFHIAFAVTLLFIIPAVQAQAGTEPICYVCGSEDLAVGNPDAEIQFPDRDTTDNCADIQEGGLQNAIPASLCPFLPSLIAECECQPGDPTKRPTSSPVSGTNPNAFPTTMAPVFTILLPPTPAPNTFAPATSIPTLDPTFAPVITTLSPSLEPTMEPTIEPTMEPTTISPTVLPTNAPFTMEPTPKPTDFPSPLPSKTPSETPSEAPVTSTPTLQPTTGSPVTVPTTPAPTRNPSATPTLPPSNAPVYTLPPTTAPITSTPTLAPTTGSPVIEPTTPPPTKEPTDAPVTVAPVTAAPVQSPQPTPELESDQPSSKPTTSSPVATTQPPTTDSPVTAPVVTTISPTVPAATESPTESVPSESPTNVPPLVGPEVLTGLQMTLNGVTGAPLSAQEAAIWQEVTRTYVIDFFASNPGMGVSDVTTAFRVTSQSVVGQRRLLGNRQLQQDQVILTYDQTVQFRTFDSTITPEYAAEQPFFFTSLRTEYNRQLRSAGEPSFEALDSSSNVRFPNDNDANGSERGNNDVGGLSMGIIIAVAVGGAVAVALFVGGGFYLNNRKKDKGYPEDTPPLTVSASGAGDEVSRLDDPSKVGPIGDISVGYGDQSVATVDYDYSKAYGGAADHSVSSAGGTFGSNTHTGGNQSAVENDPYGTGPPTLGSFDDESYGDSAFRENNAPAGPEVLMDIYAPPGKLGVVIDTPDDGAPVVHAVKETSVIAGKLQVGDKLVAVDDEDVRNMTAIKVSKLISRKSANATRKLSIIRTAL